MEKASVLFFPLFILSGSGEFFSICAFSTARRRNDRMMQREAKSKITTKKKEASYFALNLPIHQYVCC